MQDSEIREIVKRGRPLLLEDDKGNLFFYLDKFQMLIPIQQDGLEKAHGINTEIVAQKYPLKNVPFTKKELVKSHYAQEIFAQLKRTSVAEKWKIQYI